MTLFELGNPVFSSTSKQSCFSFDQIKLTTEVSGDEMHTARLLNDAVIPAFAVSCNQQFPFLQESSFSSQGHFSARGFLEHFHRK